MSIVVTAAHGSVGVNVYVVVPMIAVLIIVGTQVPVNPLLDVAGNTGAVLFWHKGPICVKVGVTVGLTVMVRVVVVAHCPAVGVKV